MKKKGFTLIELLAVIIILAVLALILTPMISDIISNASEAAFKQTINGVLSSAENYVTSYTLDNNGADIIYPITFTCDGESCKDEYNNKLVFNGKVPLSGTIVVEENSIVAYDLCDEKRCGSGSKDNLIVSGGISGTCEYPIGTEWEFDYLDETNENRIHAMNVPCKGYYKLEVWGAQGGSYSETYHGGYGGYSVGKVLLDKTDTLYIGVGGQGKYLGANRTGEGGYNGGGSIIETWGDGNERRSTGGGATHIALNNNLGELKNYFNNKNDILIVAGGGGGTVVNAVIVSWGTSDGGSIGGSGGGTNGGIGSGTQDHEIIAVQGGTQVSGQGHGMFGIGGTMPLGGDKPGLYAGGGGGFYGGSEGWRGAGGGSGYLSNKLLDGKMYCFNCMEVEDAVTENTDEVEADPISEVAKKENGYAKVTYVGSKNVKTPQTVWKYKYTGSVQEFAAQEPGLYKIELWGAQGGNYNESETYIGGKGGYTNGIISLTKNEKLYVYVGGQPSSSSTTEGGYNGGGICTSSKDTDGRTGGGATDVRLVSGEWNNAESLASRIMVAGGGGGASYEGGSWWALGGPGGGLTGLIASSMGSSAQPYYGTGGTQTAGGTPNEVSPYPEKIDNSVNANGRFGIGGGGSSTDGGAGGGGGYYGGAGTGYLSGGGGGSSYISGHTGCVAITSQTDITPKAGCDNGTTNVECSYHYSNKKFTDTTMIDGVSEMPTHSGKSTMNGNTGNGYAKITLIK